MKKVIITGVGGFIGKSICLRLLRSNVTVIGIDVDDSRVKDLFEFSNFSFKQASFSEYDQLEKIIKDRDVDVLYHFALKGGLLANAINDVDMQLENAKYTVMILKKAIEMSVKKFVFIGTANQFEVQQIAYNEDVIPRNTCIYAASKLASEMMCKVIANQHEIIICSALCAMVYGEGNYSMQLPNVVMKQIIEGAEPRLIDGNSQYDMVYIHNLTKALSLIGEQGENNTSYYIGSHSNDLLTFKELWTEIRNIINPDIKLGFGEFKDSFSMDYSKINCNKLYEELGYRPEYSLQESVNNSVEWIKNNLMEDK
ncbi:NAD-dependent epimerase/dehydratase family protein [Tannockella kyphosi]|uniref:NAD-dependent epimerase/dehydratase family protein n=1 Tax=Tannockella kyphosi TaxID=2899121 RepID=UPI002011FDD2|nr:NAD(P)-dependent oxidoreductase [Tannockella kyphosi]